VTSWIFEFTVYDDHDPEMSRRERYVICAGKRKLKKKKNKSNVRNIVNIIDKLLLKTADFMKVHVLLKFG